MTTANEQTLLEGAAQKIRLAASLVVLTGAGVSKESGIPTFRDAQTGLWAQYDPQELASPEGFLRNPTLVWDWYDSRRNTVWQTQPNEGHRALATLQQWCDTHQKAFNLVTQNIDALHQNAGNKNVLELHGNIFRYQCFDRAHPVDTTFVQNTQERPPRCPECDSLVRPQVVWFGEMLPQDVLNQAMTAAAQTELMLIVGTSGLVYPAAGLPQVAQNQGASLIEVNPEKTALTAGVDIFLQGASGIILPRLMALLADA